ncbi:hypothetical protein D9M68_596090 [compost metagenome]
MAALHGAVALAQPDGIAPAIGQHLDFDMARVLEELLHIDFRVVERGAGLRTGHRDGVQQRGLGVDHAHAAATAAARGLDDDRVADFARNADDFLRIVRQRAFRTRHHRHAGFDHGVLGADLVAHQADGVGTRADEHEAALLDAIGEIGVLGQEAVARVDGLGIRDFGSRNDGRHVQVAFTRRRGPDAHGFIGQAHVLGFAVSLGVHDHGLDAQLAASALNAQGDFAPIGDQDFFEHFQLSANDEEGLTVLDGLAVFDQDFFDDAGLVGFDFIEQLHGFNDAERIAFLDRGAHIDERRGARIRRAVKGANHGGLHDMALDHRRGFRNGRGRRSGLGHGRDGHAGFRLVVGDRLQGLRELDDPHFAFAFGDFQLGDTRFSHQVDQGFEFSKIHRSCFPR